MARHLHFDCFNGISGDMTLGALVDLGIAVEDLQRGLAKLPIGPFALRAETIERAGIVATKVTVEVEEDPHPHAHLRHVVEKVRAADLPPRATERAVAAFGLIAEAEARVHGSTPEKIHFHEVGAKDAIVDIAGSMLGVEMLGVESFSASAIAVGNGTVKCAHGVMPVPTPATVEILIGAPMRATDIDGELATPTGAAIMRTLAGDAIGARPQMRTSRIGYGAGTREIPGHPNCLRLLLGETEAPGSGLPVERDEVLSLETEIDDMSPELCGHLMSRLLSAGALDVQFHPVQMKKNRPGLGLRALCSRADADRLAEIILRETSTFGLRVISASRLCLARRSETVATPVGPIEVKIGLWNGAPLKVSPEYESCREAAERSGRPLREIYDLARRAWADASNESGRTS
jgi:hypothetical protein